MYEKYDLFYDNENIDYEYIYNYSYVISTRYYKLYKDEITLCLYNKFLKKHIYKKRKNDLFYYYKLYNNNLPQIITCFFEEPKFEDFKILDQITFKNQYVCISKEKKILKIFYTKSNTWKKKLYYIIITFKRLSNTYLPIHIISIEK